MTANRTVFVLTSDVPDRVSGTDLDILAAAFTLDQKQFCAAWGLVPPLILVKQHVQSAPPNAAVIRVVGTPSDPDALAWHTEDAQGHRFIEAVAPEDLDVLAPPIDGTDSVAQRIDHEIKETMADGAVNRWIDRFDGTEVALEVCDPVQGDFYIKKTAARQAVYNVALSNYVLPSWFDPQTADTAVDACHTAPGPLKLARGGYQVLRKIGADLPVQWGRRVEDLAGPGPVHVLVDFDAAVPDRDRARIRRRVALRHHSFAHPGVRRPVLTPADPAPPTPPARTDTVMDILRRAVRPRKE